MSRLCAVAWDIDGTLVDSEPLHLRALLGACRAHDVDITDLGPTPFVGVAIAHVWQSLAPRFEGALGRHPDRGERAFRAAVTAHYLEHTHAVAVMPGAREALEHLAREGVLLAAVSNSERPIVMANLQAIGVADLFSTVVSLDDVQRPKPHPQPYTQALAALGVPTAAAWAVEDSPSGARSARAAGLRVLVVGGDTQAQGDHRLPGLEDFTAWWQSLHAQGPADPGGTTRLAAHGA